MSKPPNNKASPLGHHKTHTSMALIQAPLFANTGPSCCCYVYFSSLKTHTSGFVCLLWRQPIMTLLSGTIGLQRGQRAGTKIFSITQPRLPIHNYKNRPTHHERIVPKMAEILAFLKFWILMDQQASTQAVITVVKENQSYSSHVTVASWPRRGFVNESYIRRPQGLSAQGTYVTGGSLTIYAISIWPSNAAADTSKTQL